MTKRRLTDCPIDCCDGSGWIDVTDWPDSEQQRCPCGLAARAAAGPDRPPVPREGDPMNWEKSSYSGNSGCVEVVRSAGFALIRDSSDPHTVLVVTAADWVAFLAGVKAGEFDAPPERGDR